MHFAIETGEQDGKCRKCGGKTLLLCPDSQWRIDCEDVSESDEIVEINEEVTAHYCKTCDMVTGFWINT